MAIVTFGNASPNNYYADYFQADTSDIGTATATLFTYETDDGQFVQITGTGITYDANGRPFEGRITKVEVFEDDTAATLWLTIDYTALPVSSRPEMIDFFSYAFGWDDGEGNVENPNGFNAVTLLLKGNDTINGGTGDDDLSAGENRGNDKINGGDGNDWVNGNPGNDKLNGGNDFDGLSYWDSFFRHDAFQGIKLDVNKGEVEDCWGGTDKIKNFEEYQGSTFADVMNGSSQGDDFAENFHGLRGADTINGRGDFDFAHHDQDASRGGLNGIFVNFTTAAILGHAAGTIQDGWGKHDKVKNIEGVYGTDLADTFHGGTKDETFLGLGGTNSFDGNGGNDRLGFWENTNQGGGGVTVDLSAATEIIDDGFGNSENADDMEDVSGSNADDDITGNAVANQINGNDGGDVLRGGGGDDDLDGNNDNDTLNGGEGQDSLDGGDGGDEFVFNAAIIAANSDTVEDFDSGAGDTILLSDAIFDLTGNPGDGLTAGEFRDGPVATEADDRIIYDSANGDLYYDADGSGGGLAVLIAHFNGNPTIVAGDIFVA